MLTKEFVYYENFAVRILKQKGFKIIKVVGKPYGIEAEGLT
jgi:Holliday junction resolvase-like predicted endonuclease